MRLTLPAALASLLTLAAPPALAQGVDEMGAYGGKEERGQYESEQNAAFELRFGPYRPLVDEGLGAKPFERTFGDDNRYLFGFEVDWQILRIPMVGTLGPGVGWGYTRFKDEALLADGSGRSAQATTLSIMPMYLVGVLRVDVLARNTVIPLVPYAKAGFGYALWWAGDGDGAAYNDNGDVGRGSSYGFQFALGGMLMLDFLDRDSAVQMDATTGVNNSYFFLEWYRADLGTNERMNVGTNTWMLGFAFEI